MAGLNKTMIIGHLGKDAELKTTDSGLQVCNFTVAVGEKYKDEKKTTWYKAVTFGKLAEICGKWLKKGSQVYLEGRLGINEWVDKDGEKQFNLEIVANQMVMLGNKNDSGNNNDNKKDDIPF